MTEKEIDSLWHKAMKESVAANEMYTRYRFAEMVAEAERERCANILIERQNEEKKFTGD